MASLIEIAGRIAAAPDRASRSAILDAVPAHLRELVGKLGADMLGADIARVRGRDARKAAIAEVPVELVDRVCARVTMLFQSGAELKRIDASREPGAVLL